MGNLFSVEGLFYKVAEKLWCLFLLNLLMLVTSLPLVTIGAVWSSGYSVCYKLIDDRDTAIVKNYFQAFRKNFKQSSFLWLILLILFFVVFVDVHYLVAAKSLISLPALGLASVFLLSCIWLQVGFFYIARYAGNFKQVFINSLKLFFKHPLVVLGMFLVTLLPIVGMLVSPYLFVFGLYLSLFIGQAFSVFLQSHLALYMLKKYEI